MKKKKLVACVLSACMMFSTAAVSAAADGTVSDGTEAQTLQQNQVSDGFTYEVLEDGTLSITGYTGSASEITIPAELAGKKVTRIAEDAFITADSSESLTSVVISEGITTIGEYAFVGNESLTSISIPDSVTSIGKSALMKCGFSRIELPENLTYIADDLFSGCANLKEIVWPENVTDIGENAFRACTSLESITIPDGVELVNLGAFYGCTNLKTVNVPDSVDDFGGYVFYECTSLTDVRIPYGTTDIGEKAFYGCTSLKSLTLPSTINTLWGTEVFSGCSSDFILRVVAGTYTEQYAKENGYAYEVYEEEPYPDVNVGDWYYDYVCWAYNNNLMSGYDNGSFGPADLLTRGQFSIILYRYEGTPESTGASPFPDVADGLYYTDAIVWAKGTGVVGGYDNGYFGPDDYMNREQLATMMFRYAKYKGYDTSARADLSRFPDAGNVNAFASEAMQWAVAQGLISGDNGNLNPQGNANRAETATIVSRFVNAY